MGKSGKKVKSDKINALRKQYDAFLEDDKKRKDRNEYILGRLEHMRSSTALVRIRDKENSHIHEKYIHNQRIPSFNKYTGMDDKTDLRVLPTKINIGVDSLPKQFESSIIREISKNYILIPKVQSCVLNGLQYSNPSIDDVDTDWKSKYNILNELKKNEKESISDKANDVKLTDSPQTAFPVPVSSSKHNDKIYDNKRLDNLDDIHKTPNNELEPNMLNSNTFTSNKIIEDHFDKSPDYKSSIKNEESIKLNQHEVEIPNKCESFSMEPYDQNPISDTYKNETDYNELHDGSKFEESANVNHTNDNPENIETIESKIPDKQSEKIMGSDNFVNERPIQQKTEETFKEDHQLDNAVRFEKNDNVMLCNKDNIEILDPQEIIKGKVENELESNDIQNYESHEIPMDRDKSANEEVSDLEKEQNEMFYTESSDTNYGYDQGNINTSEYAVENENYTNEQYSYYDEPQEQPYISEINEHEESTERYDPSYEQQYNGDYGNVVNQLQYENQQYEIENNFEIQQEPVEQSENYKEQQPTDENLEQLSQANIQNQQDPEGYNYETQALTNENYDSQQYVQNEQQEYSTPALGEQDQYAVQQEYTQMHTEQNNIIDMEKQLDTEDGYIVNENTTSKDITDANVADDLPVKSESSLEASS